MSVYRATATESAYVVREVSPEAITKSLRALLPSRLQPMSRRRFTVLDTFDGRVRRSGTRLTRGDVHGISTMAWQPRGGGPQLTVPLKEPVGFAWDLPDPLQQVLMPVIGVRR